MIRILDGDLNRLGIVKIVDTASRIEEINGENTFNFSAILSEKIVSLIDANTVFEVNDDYFDLATFDSDSNYDGTHTVDIEADHISYRLNNSDYDVEYFARTGTPSSILSDILEGTGFTVGTVEFTDSVTYSAQEAKSRRQLLMEFVAYISGELIFDKLTIGIVTHRGSTKDKPLIEGKHVEVIKTKLNKRTLDDDGNPTKSYTCEPISLENNAYLLGDDVRLIKKSANVDESLRLTRLEYNPYKQTSAKYTFGTYENELASSLYKIETESVVKDVLYNGARIGPVYGFESVRNDKFARAYFRSDGLAFQSGDGTGENWVDRLYYEYDSVTDETYLVFDGKLSTYALDAVKASIDIVVTNTTITNTLYSEYARIANLTVSELDTSWKKMSNYLKQNTAPVKYRKIYEDREEVWIATVTEAGDPDTLIATATGDTTISLSWNNPTNGVTQLTDKEGRLLYWVDITHTGYTTTNTGLPVFTYSYDDVLKKVEYVETMDGVDVPVTIWGAGDGVSEMSGRMKEYKTADGFYMEYHKRGDSGEVITFAMTDTGQINGGSIGETAVRNITISATAPTNPVPDQLWIDKDA